MSSSAFSIKRFDTLSPDICKPPPLPPVVPPPPIKQTIFSVFATFSHSGWPGVPKFAATTHIYYRQAQNQWTSNPAPPSGPSFITAYLSLNEPENWYHLQVTWHWKTGGKFTEWDRKPWQTAERPYVGLQLEKLAAYYNQIMRAKVTEIPA